MKKALAIGLCALPLMASSVLAKPAPKATGGVQWMTATATPVHAYLSFNAQGDLTDAKGRVNLRVPETGAEFSGDVTCYSQTGNVARFSGTVDPEDVVNGLTHFRVTVEDNGEPGTGTTPDRVYTQRFTSPQPICQNNNAAAADIIAGNLQVH